MTIVHYEFGPTRSQCLRWILTELGIDYESSDDRSLFGSDELKKMHPLGKLPSITDKGRPLFAPAAICTWRGDSHPEKGLIAPFDTGERALHDQWCAYIMNKGRGTSLEFCPRHVRLSGSPATGSRVCPERSRAKAVHG